MTLNKFKHSDSLSMGVELELQLINLSSFDLSPSSPALLDLLQQDVFPGMVTPEITESMIEVATTVHLSYQELLTQLRAMRTTLLRAAKTLDIGIAGGGTHPFQMWSDRRIFQLARYEKVSERYAYLAQQFTVFGQHIHIGCSSGDEAMFLLHALNRYVPHFIALSGNSPFVQGTDTGYHSARLNSISAFPLSGRAPFILNWQQFCSEHVDKLVRAGILTSMKDFYWDTRPKPEFGTIELRVCDTPLSVERAAALAAYLQALCRYLLTGSEPAVCEEDYLVYDFNRFEAARFGFEAQLVDARDYQRRALRDDIAATIEKIRPHARALNSEEALLDIEDILAEGDESKLLRHQYERRASFPDMVGYSIARFRGDAI